MTSTGREQFAREERPAAGAPGADEAATGRRHARAGLAEPALRHLLAARNDRETAGDDAGAAGLDVDIGEVCAGRGEHDRAQAFLDRAAGHAERTGDRRLAGRAQVGLAELALARGDLARADDGFAAAAAALHGDDDAVARCLAGRAVIAAERGLVDTGARLAADAEAMAVDALTSGRAALAAAAVAWRAGDAAQATAGFRRAIAVFADHGLRRDLAEAHLRFGLFCGEIAEQGGRAPTSAPLTPLDAPAGHLARAQELLRATGNLGDLERVRTAFRRFGRRATDRPVEPELGQLLTDLRQQRLVVQETAGRLVDGAAISDRQVALTTLDDALRELALAEDRLVAAVHAVVVERESIRGLLELTRSLAAVDDYAALPGAIARLACQLTGGDRALTYLVDGGRGAWAIDPATDRSWAGAVAEAAAGGPQLHGGRRGDRTTSREGGSSPPLGHAMTAPLRAGGRILGALWVDRAPTGGLFAARDLDLLSVFAGQAAAILDNARIAEALRLAARTTTATLEAISDGVVAIDTSGAITAINASGARILGLSGGVVRGADTTGEGAPLLDVLRASLGPRRGARRPRRPAGRRRVRLHRPHHPRRRRRRGRPGRHLHRGPARHPPGPAHGRLDGALRPRRHRRRLAGAAPLPGPRRGRRRRRRQRAGHRRERHRQGAGRPGHPQRGAARRRPLRRRQLRRHPARPPRERALRLRRRRLHRRPPRRPPRQVRAGRGRHHPARRDRRAAARHAGQAPARAAGAHHHPARRQPRDRHQLPGHRDHQPRPRRRGPPRPLPPGPLLPPARHPRRAAAAARAARRHRPARPALPRRVVGAPRQAPGPARPRGRRRLCPPPVAGQRPRARAHRRERGHAGAARPRGRDRDPGRPPRRRRPRRRPGAGLARAAVGQRRRRLAAAAVGVALAVPGAAAAAGAGAVPGASAEPEPAPVKTLSDSERELLVAALTSHRGRIPAVARALGVSRGTVYNKMRKFNLDPERFR